MSSEFQAQIETLPNGVRIPVVGFGTWQLPINDSLRSTINTAIQIGYRQFDTAQIYNNAAIVGDAIRDSGIDRSEFFITSKIWTNHRSYESAIEAFEEVLSQLRLDYLDMLLIHWPASQGEAMVWQAQNAGVWRAFEDIYKQGRVKAIGVSNFLPHHLIPLLARAKIAPMVNQLEFHPGYPQWSAVNFCKSRGIKVQAWSPLGRGGLIKHPILAEIAERHAVSTSQVALRWCIEHGVMPIPKATNTPHLQQNCRIFDFSLDPEEVKLIDEMPQTAYSGLHPDTVTF